MYLFNRSVCFFQSTICLEDARRKKTNINNKQREKEEHRNILYREKIDHTNTRRSPASMEWITGTVEQEKRARKGQENNEHKQLNHSTEREREANWEMHLKHEEKRKPTMNRNT